ncbi:MAG: HAMP domain-containing protein [Actinobacteria bacterium]|nr:MAG: HAMP domain-containing protein [Actinomycetota bacterium]
MRRLVPRGLRHRVMAVVLLGAVLGLAALTAGFNLVLSGRLDADANSVLRARTAAQLATLAAPGGRLQVREAPDDAAADSQVWIYTGSRLLERPRANRRDQGAAEALVGGPRRFVDVAATDTRLYAVPVSAGGRSIGTVVAGLSLAPYENSRHTALLASLVFAAVLLVAIALGARWAIGGALRPVARMTEAAADWSEHDLDQRFAAGEPRDELTRLAATFDRLLDRLAASLRREQRFSGELSHELRTPLANLLAETELALRRERSGPEYREALAAVHRSAEQMSGILETLIAAARAETGLARGTSDGARAARRAAEAAGGPKDVPVDVIAPREPLRVGADGEVVERMLVPLVDNARRHARSRVTIDVGRDGRTAAFTVVDDGPGVAEADCERIFEPGVSGNGSPGAAGLGLALARRLARAAGGDVRCLPGDGGGRFELRVPAG